MGRYLVRRIISSFLTFIVIVILTFFLFRLLPGNPVRLLFRHPSLTQSQVKELNTQFGLDQSLWAQLFLFARNVVVGNWGISFYYKAPVVQVLFPALWNSLVLILPATVLSILIGIRLGIISGWKYGSATDISILTTSLIIYAIPSFWIGTLLIMMSMWVGGIPVSGMLSLGVDLSTPLTYIVSLLSHMFLPVLTLTISTFSEFSIIMRSSVLSELTEDYVVAAFSKGMSNNRLLSKHIVPNALLPTVTIIAINIGRFFCGSVLTETVFSWPGVGLLIYSSIGRLDYPMLQGAFLVIAFAMTFSNFVADLVYAYLDPRVRYD